MGGIEFMLGHGTCLGAYRDMALIEDDHDLDIWLFDGDIRKIKEIFKCKARRMVWKLNQYTMIIYGHRFDIVLWEKKGNEYHLYFTDRGPDVLPERLAETKPFVFLGEEFLIPKHTEEYLEYYYDKDWRTPKKGRPANIMK